MYIPISIIKSKKVSVIIQSKTQRIQTDVLTDVLTRYNTIDSRTQTSSTPANKINTARSLSVHWLQSSLLHTDRAAALAWPGD